MIDINRMPGIMWAEKSDNYKIIIKYTVYRMEILLVDISETHRKYRTLYEQQWLSSIDADGFYHQYNRMQSQPKIVPNAVS